MRRVRTGERDLACSVVRHRAVAAPAGAPWPWPWLLPRSPPPGLAAPARSPRNSSTFERLSPSAPA
eukprot:5415247-Pyramimonas_sp.AAC.1